MVTMVVESPLDPDWAETLTVTSILTVKRIDDMGAFRLLFFIWCLFKFIVVLRDNFLFRRCFDKKYFKIHVFD